MVALPKTESVVTATKKVEREEVEFGVRRDKNCALCFQMPLLGLYYAHGFDYYCSRCVENRPEEGETVTELKGSVDRGLVLKLEIDNCGYVQVRRLQVQDIWDKSASQLSLAKLSSITAAYIVPVMKETRILEHQTFDTETEATDHKGGNANSTPSTMLEAGGEVNVPIQGDGCEKDIVNGNALPDEAHSESNKASNEEAPKVEASNSNQGYAFLSRAKCTYVDGEGEAITISSNKELEDAFCQWYQAYHYHQQNKPKEDHKKQLFRIKMTLSKD